jgi:carbonic anhydrase/acetyltransferase-like protein (isoleucine patch superfamily)
VPESSIRLGSGVVLISKSFATNLGVNYLVILRTLARGAETVLSARERISVASICAASLVQIGDDTLLWANVTVADRDFHSVNPFYRSGPMGPMVGTRKVVIGYRVFIGTNRIVLKAPRIGDNSVIPVGSLVIGYIA